MRWCCVETQWKTSSWRKCSRQNLRQQKLLLLSSLKASLIFPEFYSAFNLNWRFCTKQILKIAQKIAQSELKINVLLSSLSICCLFIWIPDNELSKSNYNFNIWALILFHEQLNMNSFSARFHLANIKLSVNWFAKLTIIIQTKSSN